MNNLPQLKEVFDKLRSGAYITHEQGGLHATLAENYDAYKDYFEPLGMNLVRHPRDFFYLHTEAAESTPASTALSAVAVFSFVLIESTSTKRAGTPDDIASAVHFLASPGARQITGQVLAVNGGERTSR